MVKFKDLFPDYNSYLNDEYLMNESIEGILREIAQKFPKSMREYRRKVPAYSLGSNMITSCNIVCLIMGLEFR